MQLDTSASLAPDHAPALSGQEHAPAGLSVLDLVPVCAGRTRTQALAEMVDLARTADQSGYRRYWIAEHHASGTFLAAATTVLMGQVLAATERIGVASGGVMLPNHAPLVVAEQIGTLAALYPGRVSMGLGRAPGTDARTAAALRRRHADPRHFAEEVLETLSYFEPRDAEGLHLPGSMFLTAQEPVGAEATAASTVRAVVSEGAQVDPWILGASVNGARVAGVLGMPFAVAAHFAPVQAEAALVTYRSVLESEHPAARARAAASVNVVVAPTQAEAEELFTTAMAASARILGGRPAPLDPPSRDLDAWRALAGDRDVAVEQAMAMSYVGTPEVVASQLRELTARWGLEELMLVTYVHDAEARRRSYRLLGQAWTDLE